MRRLRAVGAAGGNGGELSFRLATGHHRLQRVDMRPSSKTLDSFGWPTGIGNGISRWSAYVVEKVLNW